MSAAAALKAAALSSPNAAGSPRSYRRLSKSPEQAGDVLFGVILGGEFATCHLAAVSDACGIRWTYKSVFVQLDHDTVVASVYVCPKSTTHSFLRDCSAAMFISLPRAGELLRGPHAFAAQLSKSAIRRLWHLSAQDSAA